MAALSLRILVPRARVSPPFAVPAEAGPHTHGVYFLVTSVLAGVLADVQRWIQCHNGISLNQKDEYANRNKRHRKFKFAALRLVATTFHLT
jgi:hypothetical protein